jgi:hypothetical protein
MSTQPIQDGPARSRRALIGKLLMLVATLLQLIRILNVQSTTGESPFLSANDRSRWCTILALSVNGNYVIDDVIQIRSPTKPFRRTWHTIDMVQHRGSDGQQHFYSSKPPLLPTLYTGVYWIIRNTTGASLTQHTFFVARVMLIVVNLMPLILLWWLLIRWADRYCAADWQFISLSIIAVAGTFLSTFSVTLNNHLPAAFAAAASLWAIEKICIVGDQRSRWFILAGVAASFTAANELPALLWIVVVGGLLASISVQRTIVAYLPALMPVALAFFATNYWAHGTWRPAYSQRAVGALITTHEAKLPNDLNNLDPQELVQELRPQGIELSPQTVIRKGRRAGVWELWDQTTHWRIALQAITPTRLGIYHWGDWYDYPGSYWIEGRKKGVDIGEPSPLKYAFHCLIGHHGILSLTPFWLVSIVGAWRILSPNRTATAMDTTHGNLRLHRYLAAAICFTTLIVLSFYLTRPLEDRNYGGVCCGLRWSFWLIPMWYWLALYGIASFRSRSSQLILVLLLASSVFSTNYPWNNPWTSPWLYQLTLHQAPMR